MPNTFTGLLLLIVLLLPGAAFVAMRERRRPTVRRSALRETADVVAASVLFDVLAVVLFGLARLRWPDDTFDVGALIRGGGSYFRENYLGVAIWLGLVVLTAVALGAVGGWVVGRFIAPHSTAFSAWWTMFIDQAPSGHIVHVKATLDDGSRIDGRLLTFNYDAEDSTDRELVLLDPIRFASSEADEGVEYAHGAASISARRIVTLLVFYLPEGIEDEVGDSPGTTASSSSEPGSTAEDSSSGSVSESPD